MESLGFETVADAWRVDLPGEVVNDRGDRQVLRIHPPNWGGRPVYLKRWRFPLESPYRWLPGKNDLRNRGRTEKENLERLLNGGIHAPLPLAMGEVRGIWGPTDTFLLLDELSGYRASSELLPLGLEDSLSLIRGVTETLAKLHQLGWFARSPGLKHFYVSEDLSRFGLIDVPRLDRSPSFPIRWIKGLSGGEVPGRERDLSKVFVEWSSHYPNESEWIDSFWGGYAIHCPELAGDRNWRSRVIGLAGRRSLARGRRA